MAAEMNNEEQRRLAAIMFSDICGYSKIMGKDETAALEFVRAHERVVSERAAEHGGRVIKKMGDGLLSEFSSAVNSVKCALVVQEVEETSEWRRADGFGFGSGFTWATWSWRGTTFWEME